MLVQANLSFAVRVALMPKMPAFSALSSRVPAQLDLVCQCNGGRSALEANAQPVGRVLEMTVVTQQRPGQS